MKSGFLEILRQDGLELIIGYPGAFRKSKVVMQLHSKSRFRPPSYWMNCAPQDQTSFNYDFTFIRHFILEFSARD